MNQFKDYFLGFKKDMCRATSSQKCLRTGDLEDVGRTAYHHSFFEMLGNFSFGDYFKEEAILWAWEFLTKVLKISTDRLRVTVHETDEDAYLIWKDKVKIREDWIYKMGDKSNYWPSNAPQDGPNGPCGPCSEIYFDMSEDATLPAKDLESQRFAEIWNLVFTQFDRGDGGTLTPLKNKNIDTGMGLERLACVLQEKTNNFEIDLFQPIHAAILKELELEDKASVSLEHRNAIADHVRAIVFCMHDGAMPSNEGRGYVVRKLIRRALWHALQLKEGRHLEGAFLFRVAEAVVAVMKTGYPELQDSKISIQATLKAEEDRFLATLETGLQILDGKLQNLKRLKVKVLAGADVFELYDTYGFPEELTRVISEEQGFSVDLKSFETQMQAQRKRAKDASQISLSIFVTDELEKKVLALPATKYVGYAQNQAEGQVLLVELREAGKGILVLDQTPFYGESGGQVGDQGEILGAGFKAEVIDTQKKDDRILHVVHIISGEVVIGSKVRSVINLKRRNGIMRNHTATHLLHAALRKVLGPGVRQLGSLVSDEKLRFDYAHSQALSAKELRSVENEVNEQILMNALLDKSEKTLDEAKKEGALAFFGDKYGERVRIVTVGDYSKEFCGGVHCDSTGQIGSFIILGDSSVASGTRRIEAVTGEGAIAYLRSLQSELSEVAGILKSSPAQLKDRVLKLQDNLKKLEKERKAGVIAKIDPKLVLSNAVAVGDLKFAHHRFDPGTEMGDLRGLSDAIRSMSAKTLYFLGAEGEEKIHFVIGLSPDLSKSDLDARDAMKKVASILGGTGGGRKELVQGGARNSGQLKDWDSITGEFVEFLKERERSCRF